jgi:hypothetical protein
MMNDRQLSTTLITGVISLLLMALFAAPTPAAKRWRESKINGGLQIWIAAADFDRRNDFDRRDAIKTGTEVPELAKKAPQPVLGNDILLASNQGAFVEYDFEIPPERGGRNAFFFCRVMDFRGGGQSWFVVLNTRAREGRGLTIDTKGNWNWKSGRVRNFFPTILKKGGNTLHVRPAEARARMEILMDIFVISTTEIQPTDVAYQNATRMGQFPVQPSDKLATTWAAIKDDSS